MKLELKHLAGYLPYGLNTKYQLSGVIGLITEQRDEVRDKKLTTDSCDFVLKYCKPILRPLSDLTKEIEINEEKFVPHLKLGGRPNLKDYDFVYFKKNIENLSFGLIQQLLEWHFDIYGLIENNLAIDINTINNDN